MMNRRRLPMRRNLSDVNPPIEQGPPTKKNSVSVVAEPLVPKEPTPVDRLETWKDVLFRDTPSTEWMTEYLKSHAIHLKPDVRLQFKRMFSKDHVIKDGEEWKVTAPLPRRPVTSKDRYCSWLGIPNERKWTPTRYWMEVLLKEMDLQPTKDVNHFFKSHFSSDEVLWDDDGKAWKYVGDPSRAFILEDSTMSKENDENAVMAEVCDDEDEHESVVSSIAVKAISAEFKEPGIEESNDQDNLQSPSPSTAPEPKNTQESPKQIGAVEPVHVDTMADSQPQVENKHVEKADDEEQEEEEKDMTPAERRESWIGVSGKDTPPLHWQVRLLKEQGFTPIGNVTFQFKCCFAYKELAFNRETKEWRYLGAPRSTSLSETKEETHEQNGPVFAYSYALSTGAAAFAQPGLPHVAQPVHKFMNCRRQLLAHKINQQLDSVNWYDLKTHCVCEGVDIATFCELIVPHALVVTPSSFDKSTPVVVATISGWETLWKIIGTTKIHCVRGEFVYEPAREQLRFWWTMH